MNDRSALLRAAQEFRELVVAKPRGREHSDPSRRVVVLGKGHEVDVAACEAAGHHGDDSLTPPDAENLIAKLCLQSLEVLRSRGSHLELDAVQLLHPEDTLDLIHQLADVVRERDPDVRLEYDSLLAVRLELRVASMSKDPPHEAEKETTEEAVEAPYYGASRLCCRAVAASAVKTNDAGCVTSLCEE